MTTTSTTRPRWTATLALIVLAALSAIFVFPALVRADTLTSSVGMGGTTTIKQGESTAITYLITATDGDGKSDCNFSGGHSGTLTINAPNGVTATPASQTITGCGTNLSVSLTSATVGTYSITASLTGGHEHATGNDVSAAAFFLRVVSPDTTPPVITVPGPITAPATSASGAAVSYTVTATDETDGTVTATCSRVSGSTFAIGATRVDCEARDAANNLGTASFTVTVNKASQTITFNALSNKTFGDEPFQLTATASSGLAVSYAVTGNCSLSGTTVTITGAGGCEVTTSQTGDAWRAAATSVKQSFTIAKANQTITFGTLTDKKVNDANVTLSASASSGLAVSFASSTPTVCTVAGTTLDIVGAGTCTVTASQAGNDDYNPAPSVERSFQVTKLDQTITFAQPASPAVYNSTFSVAPTATSDLTVAVTASGACSITGGTVKMTSGTGTCTLTANQAGDTNYNAATSVTREVQAAKANQTITFAALGTKTFGAAPFTVSATGGDSGNPVTFAASGNCTISGATVTITGAGSCTVTASQAGDANYHAAPNVERAFTIERAPQTITFAALAAKKLGDPAFTVSATGGASGNPVTFAATPATVCTISGNSVTLVGVGTCTITASQAGNTNYLAAQPVPQSFGITYNFTGFFQPIDMGLLNSVKAGSAVPVKFTLGGDMGTSVFASGSPSSAMVACGATAEDAIEETVTAGSSGLSYDPATQQYTYVWKTDKAWAGTCRTLVVKFADGSTQTVNFKLLR